MTNAQFYNDACAVLICLDIYLHLCIILIYFAIWGSGPVVNTLDCKFRDHRFDPSPTIIVLTMLQMNNKPRSHASVIYTVHVKEPGLPLELERILNIALASKNTTFGGTVWFN